MPSLTASLVIYRTPPAELAELFASLQTSSLVSIWVVVDNAAGEAPGNAFALRQAVEAAGGRYLAAPANVGFGAGHNLALRALTSEPADYHLMVNPDVTFGTDVLPALAAVLDARPHVAWVMPRILYSDGRLQGLCKLLPTPMDFALRRFFPSVAQRLFQTQMDRYELRGIENLEMPGVPFLSGCFVLARRAVLQAVGGFDERYFLYLEDVDLGRRVARHGDLLYYPHVSITHGYHRGSHKNFKLMGIFILSSIAYFNRWGWFFDKERRRRNRTALKRLRELRPQ